MVPWRAPRTSFRNSLLRRPGRRRALGMERTPPPRKYPSKPFCCGRHPCILRRHRQSPSLYRCRNVPFHRRSRKPKQNPTRATGFHQRKRSKEEEQGREMARNNQRLVLNAASADSDSPADDIPDSYLTVINSDTAGMADKELQSQMAGLGYSDAGFAHGLAASLYAGDIKWNNRTTPSNLSPFTVFELDPLSATQSAHCMQLHILSKNTEGKSLEEIKASQIQEVKVPKSFEELHQVLQFYSGITSILFGKRSALVEGVKSFASAILTEKIIFKGCIAADCELPAKILYAMEIRIQRWLGECKKYDDRSMVNDRLVCFDEIFEMVMNCSLNVILPPNFIKSPPINPTVTPPGPETMKKKAAVKEKRGSKETETKPASSKTPRPSPSFSSRKARSGSEISQGNAPATAPSGGKNGCAPAGTSVANASLTATTSQATWEQTKFPNQSAKSSKHTSQKFDGKTCLTLLRPDFPGRGLATPGPKKNHPTYPPTPAGRQHHVAPRSYQPMYPKVMPHPPTMTTSSSIGGTTATSQLPSATGSHRTRPTLHKPIPDQKRICRKDYYMQRRF